MKKWILPIMMLTTVLHAQQVNFDINNEIRKYSGGEGSAFVVDIPDITLAEAENAFEIRMKDFKKVKAEKSGHELKFHQVVVTSISDQPIEIYGVFIEKISSVTFVGFFIVDGEYVSDKSNESTYTAAYKFVKDYASKAYLLGLEHALTSENTSLSEMKKELKAIHKEQGKIQKGLTQAKRQIEKSELKIKELKTEVELITTEIGKQKEISISSKSDPEEKKAAKKEISSLEKKRSSLNKGIDKEYSLINESQSQIRQLEIDMTDKQRVAEILTKKIEAQEQQVEGVRSKMKGVKK
jgi:chromosome segregation ATPase